MIKAILLDLDETLLDQQGASTAALREFHKHHCAPLEWETVLGRWNACLGSHFERYVRGEITVQHQRRCRIRDVFENQKMDDGTADTLFSHYLAAYEGSYALFPDVLDFLENTHGYKFGVISNGDTHQQKDKLKRMGILHHFETVLVSEEVGLRKPDARIFALAARNVGALPQECVFIGDNLEADYKGSLGAGMYSLWINRRGKEALTDIRQITTLGEVHEVIASIDSGNKGRN